MPRTIDGIDERLLEITAACYRHYQGDWKRIIMASTSF
jgi:hypothetical protein